MADEQIIYISPEEELTNVRERLERTPARRIILVIPPQTQLRSHVGWRLLHSRTRELGKDVVINSSDRQIRAVAKAAGFRVADSLESPTTRKSRPPSRPSRLGGGKAPRPHGPIGRGMPENRIPNQRKVSPGGYTPSNDRPLTQLSPRAPQPPQTPKEMDDTISRADEVTSEGGPSTFGTRDSSYGQDFEHHIHTAPSIHPLSPPFEDEEPDLLIEDFNQAQNIRQAAQVGDVDASRTETEHPTPSAAAPSSYGEASAPYDLDDPFAYREDIQPVSLPEQQGSISMDELDTDVPDIGEVPTSIIVDGEIEDLGDEGDIVDPYTSSSRSWAEPVMEEPEIVEPPRVYGMRPRNSLAGNVPRPPYSGIEDEDTLLPPEQPIRPAPPSRMAGVPASTVGNRPPQPIITPQPRMATGSPTARPAQAGAKKQPVSGRSGAIPSTTRRPAARRQNARGIALTLTVIILIFLVIGALLIFIPSADITITLPSQTFRPTAPIRLTASATSRQDTKLHTVPAEQLTFAKTVGPLPGTTKVKGEATGFVTFTNTGSQPLTVPTKTPVATKSGVRFLTLGSAVVPAGSTFPAVPIVAKDPGTIGNVPANTIVVIPSEGLTMIANATNPKPANVSLTITNASATSGGKASSTTDDINALKKMLHQQMQAQFTSWLAGHVHSQDVAGIPNPLPEENITIGPVAVDGTFSGTDSLTVTLLVVRTADLQGAARAELNAMLAASKQYRGYALVPQQSLALGNISSMSSSDGKSLTIIFTPTGLIGQHLSNDQLSNLRGLLAGRKVNDAQNFLASSSSGLQGKLNSQITLFPSFFSNIPFWTARIAIHVQYHCVSKDCPKG